MMIRIEDCVKIGKLGKPHGTRGAFNVTFASEFFEDDESFEYMLVLFEGYLVPFFIEEIKLTDSHSGYVKFDHLHSVEETSEFVNCELYVHHETFGYEGSNEENELLIGYSIQDNRLGNIGTVCEFIHHDKNPLLECILNDKTYYIPVNGMFIRSIDYVKKVVATEIPDELITLND